MLLPVILLSFALGSPGTGDIWVRFASGAAVYLDGARVGQTNDNESGALIHNVKSGAHKITIELPTGASATMDVNVDAGQMATVSVSPLALRAHRAPKGGIEVHAAPDAKCVAAVNDKQQPITDEAYFDELPPGSYHVTVTCGTRGMVQGDVIVADGRVAILDTDLKSHRLNLSGDRPRVTRVAIDDPNKAILNAPLPASVKRAIIAGLSGGATITSVKVPVTGVVIVTVDAPNGYSASTFFSRLQMTGGVIQRIEIESSVTEENGHVRLVVGRAGAQ